MTRDALYSALPRLQGGSNAPPTPTVLIALVFTVVCACQTIQAKPEPTLNAQSRDLNDERLPTEEQIRQTLQAYIDNFNAKDGEALAALFADDARIEDPVGGGKIVEGRAAVDAFYKGAVGMVDQLELAAPIRSSYGRSAAMAFDIHMTFEGQPMVIRAIDVMTFDGNGKVVDMKAYHGPGDRSAGEQ